MNEILRKFYYTNKKSSFLKIQQYGRDIGMQYLAQFLSGVPSCTTGMWKLSKKKMYFLDSPAARVPDVFLNFIIYEIY